MLGGHQKVLDGVASLEMDLDSHLATNVLEAFVQLLSKWCHHINIVIVVVDVVLGFGDAVSMVSVSGGRGLHSLGSTVNGIGKYVFLHHNLVPNHLAP